MPGRRLIAAPAAVLLLLAAQVVQADPLVLQVTGGSALGDDSSSSLRLTGSNFSIEMGASTTGDLSNLGWHSCPWPCDPASASFTGTFTGTLANGRATFGEDHYSDVTFHGSLVFVGSQTTIEPEPRTGGGYVRGPFTFSALLEGYQNGENVFVRALQGQGQAWMYFGPGSPAQNISTGFTFEPAAAPTPEPGTIALIAGGLGWLTARRRKRGTSIFALSR